MAPIVLAIGAVMVVVGGGEIFYGSGIIEIERGWSAFIAGTVLLTGGLLVVAVGLALRSLAELKGVLLQFGGLERAVDLASLTTRLAPDLAIPTREPPVALRPAEPARPLATAGPALQIEPHFGGPDDERVAPPLRLHEEAPIAAEAPRDDLHGAHEARPDTSPPMDEWLDQEFADLDRDIAQLHAQGATRVPTEPAQAEAPHVHTGSPEPTGSEYDYSDYVEVAEAGPPTVKHHGTPEPAVEPPPDRGPAAAPAPPVSAPPMPAPPAAAPQPPAPPQPAVIGRYESEGTSYVMYADGSIEAQSEAGIYRFASMAELKAFIET